MQHHDEHWRTVGPRTASSVLLTPEPTARLHRQLAPQRILVATDGLPGSDGAMGVARQLATRHAAHVVVAGIVEHRAEPGARGSEHAEASCVVRKRLDDQMDRVLRGRPCWPVVVDAGAVSARIDHLAREVNADLVVVGLSRRGAASSARSGGVPVRLASACPIPILAVPESAREIPDDTLVGVDFSRGSLSAARAALALADGTRRLRLAHVRADATEGEPPPQMVETMSVLFSVLEGQLDGGALQPADRMLLDGDPALALLEASRTCGLSPGGLLAIGRAGRPRYGRVLGTLLRGADCCVLVS